MENYIINFLQTINIIKLLSDPKCGAVVRLIRKLTLYDPKTGADTKLIQNCSN